MVVQRIMCILAILLLFYLTLNNIPNLTVHGTMLESGCSLNHMICKKITSTVIKILGKANHCLQVGHNVNSFVVWLNYPKIIVYNTLPCSVSKPYNHIKIIALEPSNRLFLKLGFVILSGTMKCLH